MIVTNNAVFVFLNTKKKVVRNTFEIDILSKTIESSIVKKISISIYIIN